MAENLEDKATTNTDEGGNAQSEGPKADKEPKETAQQKANKTKAENKKLQDQLDNLTACVAKMAHMAGAEAILREFGITPWKVGPNDMRKYKQGS